VTCVYKEAADYLFLHLQLKETQSFCRQVIKRYPLLYYTMSSDVLTFESIPTRDSKNQQVKLYCVVNDEEYVHKSPKGEKYFAYLGQVKERVKKVKKDKEVTEEDLKKLWLYDTNGESLKDYEQFSATSGYQGHRILQIAREDDKVVSLYPLGIQMYMWHPELNKSFQVCTPGIIGLPICQSS
jgi:hypothetical protein